MTNVEPRRNLLIQSMVPMVTVGQRKGKVAEGLALRANLGSDFKRSYHGNGKRTLSVWYTFSTKSRSLYRLGQVSELRISEILGQGRNLDHGQWRRSEITGFRT